MSGASQSINTELHVAPPVKDWSPQQTAIFEEAAHGEGNVRITARAGTGKTTTILEAQSHLPATVKSNTAMVAFNKSIATELQGRVPKGVQAITLHSYGLRACARALRRPQIDSEKLNRIVAGLSDSREVRTCVRQVASLAKGSLAHTREKIDELIDCYGVDIPEATPREIIVDLTRAALKKSKDEVGTLDFDDMIWLPAVLGLRGEQFSGLFVDEAQDLNAAQIALVKGALRPGGRGFVVGDDRQAIYKFRGAGERALDDLSEALGAVERKLTVTYRCPKKVVDLAKRLVPDFEASPTAPEGIVENLVGYEKILKSAAPGDFILSRSNAPLLSLCFRFLAQGTPCKIQGRDLGNKLVGMVRKLAGDNPKITGFLQALTKWAHTEIARLEKLERDTSTVQDTYECLLLLTEGLTDTKSLVDKIEALFTDKVSGEGGRLVLSSTHRAKGLERDRVWLLRDTYRPSQSLEEENLLYVALTRAKKELYLVRKEAQND